MLYIRKGPPPGEGVSLGECGGGEFAKKFPAIWEYLSADRWEDGKVRQTSTLQLFGDRGIIKAALKDRENGIICFVGGRDPDEALEALESALRAGTAEWREDTYKKRK